MKEQIQIDSPPNGTNFEIGETIATVEPHITGSYTQNDILVKKITFYKSILKNIFVFKIHVLIFWFFSNKVIKNNFPKHYFPKIIFQNIFKQSYQK